MNDTQQNSEMKADEIINGAPNSEVEGLSSSSKNNKVIEFNWGEALTPEASMQITSARPARLIVLAGAVGSGKSTIVSSLYELLQKGPIGPYVFAGSRTLLEFERISHDSRIASERQQAITERTIRTADYRLLHTEFAHRDTSAHTDILFTDITGELFEEIRNSTEECRRHPIFLRCDNFVVLVDGERLSDPRKRSAAINDATHILRRLLDANVLNNNSHVNVLFTKMDIVTASKATQLGLADYIEGAKKKKFIDQFMPRLGDLRIHEVAARPNPGYGGDFEVGHGLAKLLSEWIELHPSSRLPMTDTLSLKMPLRNRAIDKLGCLK